MTTNKTSSLSTTTTPTPVKPKSPSSKKSFSNNALRDILHELIQAETRTQTALDSISFVDRQAKLMKRDNTNNNASSKNDEMTEADVSDLVGDELLELYRRVVMAMDTVRKERRNLHSLATTIRPMEARTTKYVPWCRMTFTHEQAELQHTEELLEDLQNLQQIHTKARQERDLRLAKEAKERALKEAKEKQEKEEEERRQFLESAVKEPEAKPGMVWNKGLRQYQYLDTDES
eukprot:CAMPEP_0118677450 /NCGR_PEP_ID=MMETSP0800-20121206/2635_1 /TAXON_ID=210618 ORGANISM="Striatella unipunctata, Strain CCMP2910" /NCGR_SAMPLE_ID=MMETSP0800 /ASSEMBLY_ACC=CAM_ASM_000638 /LENGTH=232 /DNA_ID=CAMNT_0006573127 /DNA_START=39 /DNA_END=733 /DNA_ORIENTATION=+